jgi:Tol biopolymer transport system component
VGITRSGAYLYFPDPAAAGTDVFIADLQPGGNGIRGTARRLTENGANANYRPAWSPDGKSITFQRRFPAPVNGTPVARGAANHSLIVHSLETHEEREFPVSAVRGLGYSAVPAWFPDSQGILDGLTRVDLKTRQSISIEALTHSRLPAEPTAISARALSRDGKTLYLAALETRARTSSIFSINLANGNSQLIWSTSAPAGASTPPYILDLLVSPDGRDLAFAEGLGTGWRMARIAVDGTGYRPMEIVSSIVAWTKDGLYYVPANSSNSEQHVLRIPPQGGKPVPTGLNASGSMDFSPNGAQVVFSDNTGVRGLWAIQNISSLWKGAR